MNMHPGNDIDLGHIVGTNEPLPFPRTARDKHLYVCGSTGTGKSKFLEHLIRQDILGWRNSKCGLLLIDPHGSLFDSIMSWLAWHQPYLERPVIPIDLRRNDWVVGYNLLRERPLADPAVIVGNFVQAMAYVWGQAGTNETPLFARWASNIIETLYKSKKTLFEARHLTNRMADDVRQALLASLEQGTTLQDWDYAGTLSPKDFDAQISSSVSRFHRFVKTQILRRTFGQMGASLDLGRALEEGHIILVSLATEKEQVAEEDAALFATLLLSDLWSHARGRGKSTGGRQQKPFYVYIDEFQNFVTPTIAKNLDQARGFGLHLTLAHQFPNQLLHTGANGKQVYDSIFENARTKVVFSLESDENLKPLAQSLFRGVMSPDKIKDEIWSTKVMGYVEEYRTAYARSTGQSSGGGSQTGSASGKGLGSTEVHPDGGGPGSHSDSWSKFHSGSESQSHSHSETTSESESENPTLIPVFGKELSSRQYESLEEQLYRAMAVLHDQKQRQFVARVVETTEPVSVFTPTVSTVPWNADRITRYTEKILNRLPFALRAADAQKNLDDREKELTEQILKRQIADEPTTTRKRVDGAT